MGTGHVTHHGSTAQWTQRTAHRAASDTRMSQQVLRYMSARVIIPYTAPSASHSWLLPCISAMRPGAPPTTAHAQQTTTLNCTCASHKSCPQACTTMPHAETTHTHQHTYTHLPPLLPPLLLLPPSAALLMPAASFPAVPSWLQPWPWLPQQQSPVTAPQMSPKLVV